MIPIPLVIALLLFVEGALAQCTFNVRFDVNGHSAICTSVQPVEMGYLCSSISRFGTQYFQTASSLIDFEGNVLSTNIIAHQQTDFAVLSQAVAASDTVYLSGFTYDDLGLMKLTLLYLSSTGDSLGIKKWQSPFAYDEPIGNETPHWYRNIDTELDPNGNLVQLNALKSLYREVRKISRSGEVLWSNILDFEQYATSWSWFVKEQDQRVWASFRIYNSPEPTSTVLLGFDSETGVLTDSISVDNSVRWIQDIEVLDNGDFLLAANATETQDSPNLCPSLTRVAPDGSLIWSRGLSPENSPFDELMEQVVVAEDGNFVVCGEIYDYYYEEVPEGQTSRFAGCIAKFSPEGETIWKRFYIGVDAENELHNIYDMRATPDGGFIFCGESIDFDETPVAQKVWVVKTDQHGCVEPGCHFADSEHISINSEPALTLAPNPAVGSCTLQVDGDYLYTEGAFTVTLYTATGQWVNTHTYTDACTQNLLLPLQTLSAGKYIVMLEQNGVLLDVEELVVGE